MTSEAEAVIATRGLSKRFGETLALDRVELEIGAGRVVGLVGRNGSGKSTLMRHVLGLALPSAGSCRVFGCESSRLDDDRLARIGAVHQEQRFLSWMRVAQHIDYVASFYAAWDRERAARMVRDLDLDPKAQVGQLSPGNLQKLALVLATAHHPRLCVLDEPVSALDPIARETLLSTLLDLLRDDEVTIVISSHALRDVERVVDHIVCLDQGRVTVDAALDELRESLVQWNVVSRDGLLPARFAEAFVLFQEGDRHQARLIVRDGADALAAFRARHGVEIECAPLNLERMFPLWVKQAGT